jgi:hypothetical protein
MQNSLGHWGDLTLRQICIPGSHDAGMSEWVRGTSGSTHCNTLTQTDAIFGQLRSGARYFDIRPTITAKEYRTGHYSPIVGFWQGANGQSIQSIIEDVKAYTANNKELIILKLSHDLNTDVGPTSYRPFNQEEWEALLNMFADIKDRFVVPIQRDAKGVPIGPDLTRYTLSQLIGNNNAAVIILVDAADPSIVIPDTYLNDGFYLPVNFSVYDQYAEKPDFDEMKSDQLKKMKYQCARQERPYFLLSWTLTQDLSDIVKCLTNNAYSIKGLADTANARLSEVIAACTPSCFPNVLYTDNIKPDTGIVDIVTRINNLVSGRG